MFEVEVEDNFRCSKFFFFFFNAPQPPANPEGSQAKIKVCNISKFRNDKQSLNFNVKFRFVDFGSILKNSRVHKQFDYMLSIKLCNFEIFGDRMMVVV